MADIFEALSDIRKASGSGAAAVADTATDAPDNPQSGDIFSTLENIRSSREPVKGRPPDEINPPIPPTTFTREIVKNLPGALAQGAVDLGKKVVSAGKTGVDIAKSAGGDIMDALASIRQPGGASAAIKALPETVAQIGKDVGGVITKAGAGLAKGATLGAVNPEEGTVGIPFTSIKKKLAPTLADSLKQLGVSPEIADNKGIDVAPEFVGAAAPWGRISKAVGWLGKTAKAAAAGTEVAAKVGPMAATAEEAVTKLLGGTIKDRLKQTAGRVAQEGITGAIYGLAKVRGPDEDPMVNALSGAKWGAGASLGLEVLGGIAGMIKAKQLLGLKDDIAKYLYDTKAVGSEEAANHQASRIVINRLYQKSGIDNITHEEISSARATVDKALTDFQAKNPVKPTEAPVDTTATSEPVPPTTEIVPEKAPVVTPEAPIVSPDAAPVPPPEVTPPAPALGPDVYPEVSRLEADTTPGSEAAPAKQPDMIDALAEIRQQPQAMAPPPTPPAPSEGTMPEAPPEQKGNIEIPKEMPVVKPGAKEGEPHALFAYNQNLGKGFPVDAYFNIFGDKAKILEMTKGESGWGSSVTLGTLQKHGIPIVGREPRAEGMVPGEMNTAASKAFEQPKFEAAGGGAHALAPMPSEPGPATPPAPKGKPEQPEFQETKPKETPGPPEATPEAPVFELPEMVQLAKELMEGKFPQVIKRIRAAGGNALGVFYPGRGIIQIRADQFKNPEDAAHTLSHEVGHLVDWLPEKDIMRGNIIGRIASLQKYMKDKFVGESFEKHLYNNKKFRNELIALTNRWHPFDAERAPKSYLAYRYSAPELYAEAWSVLLNNPKFLKDEAPAFYKAFFDYLDKKPHVKELYDDLHEVIRQGRTAETRHERETAAYAKEDLAAKLRNEAKGHPLRTIWDEMREAFIDENAKIISSVAKARKAGIDVPAGENPMHALEDLRYSSAEMSDYAREQGNIYHRLKDNGIEWNDLGAYLKADRVINERSELANPGGQTPKAAKEEIAFLEKKYGDKFAGLKAAADEMRGPRRDYLIQELEKANMVSPQLMKRIRENKAYSPFDIIIDDAEKSLGGTSSNVGPQIYSQIGTLRDIKNPATALVMKDLSLLRAIRVQQAKLKQADWMLKHEPSWIVPAETKWNGVAHVPMEPADKENTGLLAFYQGGKIRAYYVPRTIADSFRYDPKEASLMMDAWDQMNSFFKQIFTAANPGFQVMNVPRDMSSLVMNIRGMSYSKAIRYYIKVAGSAKRFAASEHDDLVQEMLRRKVLITPQNRWSSVAHDVEMESIINRFSDKENEYKHWYSKVFGPLLDRVKMLGQVSEAISKVAGFKYLKDNQKAFNLTDEDINHLVRFQAGSPPFLVTGKQSRAISRVLLFFNPHVQGYRRSFEAARLQGPEYAAKLMKYVFLPKLLQYLAWAGVFGAGARAAYRKVSSYNHANYHIIPIGEGENQKTIALKIPMDDTERFFGGLLWYALTSQPVAKTLGMLGYQVPTENMGQDATKLFAYTAGQAPNLTPGIGAMVDLVQYASGHNPYDYFRGKAAIPDQVFAAGGERSHVAMLKFVLNELGAGLVYRFNTSDVQKVKSTLDKVLGAPVIGNIFSRFILSTNYGDSELIANRVAMAKEEDARQHLDYREAVVQNIMAHDKPADPGEVAKLYADMMKAGLLGDALHLKKFTEFQNFYQRLQSQRLDDPYANGLLFAKSDAEKGAVLDVAKENLSEVEYKKLVGYSLTQKFIHAKTLVADELKKATKR